MKKLTRLFFVFIFIIACLAIFASCGKEYSEGLQYTYDYSDGACVEGLGKCKDRKVIIPEKDNKGNDVIVISMSLNSYMDCTHVTEMILPKTLRWFNYGYETMTREMPNLKFNEYGYGKYLGTKDNPYFVIVNYSNPLATAIEIHPDTKIIAPKVFQDMENLTSAIIPDGIRYVGSGAYRNCPNLNGVYIPPSVIAMSESTFWGCTALESITIPGTLKNVCSHMFVDCTALETVIIAEGIETIGYGAFSGCTALKDVILPKGIKTVSMSAFNGCTSLTEIAFDDGLETIGASAFSGCSNLEKISIPSSLTYIPKYAFEGCDKLKYNRYENALYLGNEETPYVALIKPLRADITTVDIHETTSAIMCGAFQECIMLKNAAIPEGVTTIGQDTFKKCLSLTKLSLPSTITGIHHWAFKDCVTLWKIEFGGTMEQWNLMKENEMGRHQGWAEGSKINKVYCSDGVIEITEEDR